MTEPVETEATTKGRPRPQATIEQDERAYAAIVAAVEAGTPLTKETLATAIDVPPNKAYLSLYRLRVADRVHKERPGGGTGAYVWVPGSAPAQVETATV